MIPHSLSTARPKFRARALFAGLLIALQCPVVWAADDATPELPAPPIVPLSTPESAPDAATAVVPESYLKPFATLARTDWPKNRSLRVVCHGHSVPAGYFKTPVVQSLDSYPHMLRAALAKTYPHAVINVIVTAIGGENAENGAKRFDSDVLALAPDVITIDYALNDRPLGLDRARAAWESMITRAKANNVPVILLTPTPDTGENLDDPTSPLNQHAAQIRVLARKHNIGLVDSLAAFRAALNDGRKLSELMSQSNHPNASGHKLVAAELVKWFP